jgi:uncharacterized alkaline shock family protein YloU
MTEEITPLGSIRISPRAIATLAARAARETYGVVGLANKNIFDGLSHALVKDPTHGVSVHYDGSQLNIELYIVVEYGMSIKEVSASLANLVRYQIEKTLTMSVSQINVHVQGLRVSSVD